MCSQIGWPFGPAHDGPDVVKDFGKYIGPTFLKDFEFGFTGLTSFPVLYAANTDIVATSNRNLRIRPMEMIDTGGHASVPTFQSTCRGRSGPSGNVT